MMRDNTEMLSPAIQDFNQKFAQFPELQQQIRQIESLPQFIDLLHQWGCNLTGPELVALAQRAYHAWIETLDSSVQAFFIEAHENKTLTQALETCHSSNDVVRLAQSYGFEISELELQKAAALAYQIDGFSFEKLWFKGIGI